MTGLTSISPTKSAAWGIAVRRFQPAFAPADSASRSARSPAKILIVEDDYFVALELEHRLVQAGYDIVGVAATADEALALAAAERPELAIMDVRLSGGRDGVDAAIEMQENFEVPSIFATAHGDRETRRRAEQALPVGWLQKPYTPTTLLALVESVLSDLRASRAE